MSTHRAHTHIHTYTHEEGKKRCIVTKLAFDPNLLQKFKKSQPVVSLVISVHTHTHAQTHTEIKTGER